MTCVARGAVVDVYDGNGIVLVPVEHIRVGMHVVDPHSQSTSIVTNVLSQKTGGLWPVYQYLGLSADAAQWVYAPIAGWVQMSNVGTPATILCRELFCIAVRPTKPVCVDGVTCCAHSDVCTRTFTARVD